MSRMQSLKGVELEVTEGITEHSSRVALKGVFQNFGDVIACWVPPIDRRHLDNASVRFGAAPSAEAAKAACDAGQVFLQGLPVKCEWRSGGGRRVGNSDLGKDAGGNSPERGTPRALVDDSRGYAAHKRERDKDRDRDRDRDRRDRRSRSRRRRSEDRALPDAPSLPALSASAAPVPVGSTQPGVSAPDWMLGLAPPPPGVPDWLAGAPGAGGGGPGLGAAAPAPVFEPVDPEAELRRKAELMAARAERAKQLKRGPGVAALVQGALKKVQTFPTTTTRTFVERKPDEVRRPVQVPEDSDEDEDPVERQKKEKEAAEARQNEAERRDKEEKEARERRAQAQREAAEAEKALQAKEAETRDQRIKASVEAAKKQQAERSAATARQQAAGGSNLYGEMPEAAPEDEGKKAARIKEQMLREKVANFAGLPQEDKGKVVFLDIDGVLRPARAGGCDILAVDAEAATRVDTSDFFPSALKAVRHIIERTGATIVLTSEWRRSEALCSALGEVFEKNRMRPWGSATCTTLELESGSDPVKSFAERRAKEVSQWLTENEAGVKGWVVLDDVNLSVADENKNKVTKTLGPRLVQTWPLCGLTMGNAKTAVRLLNGEMINKVVVERPIAPGGGLFGGGGGAATPMPGMGGGSATPMPGQRR